MIASLESLPSHPSCRSHLLSRVEQAAPGAEPFRHLFIENFFPDTLYAGIRAHMLGSKYSGNVQDREQDNPAFVNKRFNLATDTHAVVDRLRALFSDDEVKRALLAKFYVSPSRELADSLSIHDEFEYFFTEGGRFQNIHIDIPPKFLSFVFYIPEHVVAVEAQARNATILYDKSLSPHYPARFRPNSACVFAPHFYSYHGFSSTIDRDVLVMFYVNGDELQRWRTLRQEDKDAPPFSALLDTIERKLRTHPLMEIGLDDERIRAERSACRVNAPRGRVLL